MLTAGMLTGALIGAVGGLIAVLINSARAKKLNPQVIEVLRAKGPMTTPALATELKASQATVATTLASLTKGGQIVASRPIPGESRKDQLATRSYTLKG